MPVKNRKRVYWICQLSGWVLYVSAMGVVTLLLVDDIHPQLISNFVVTFILGLGLTHLYRYCIIKLGWLELNIYRLIPRVFIAAATFGMLFYFVQDTVNFFIWDTPLFSLSDIVQLVLNWAIIWVIWSSLYFTVHFFENYRKEEIKNLQWEASRNEIELNNLKAQLNPHFMFNAMNSIRALIDENPDQAKSAVTQLSTILRNGLIMGRKKFVVLQEEINIVKDYLSLELVRYEERLQVEYDLAPECMSCNIPPLMLQTIVENGIKHGISKLPKGGLLKIGAYADGEYVFIKVTNSGTFELNGKSETGIGLRNTEKRLEILFGDKATFKIFNDRDTVVTEVKLPKQLVHENDHN